MAVYAFVFPGQGSQSVGMGQDLAQAFPSARAVFEEVDDALGENLSKIIFEGPAESLTSTENTQPALMAVSMAVLRVLENEGGLDLTSTATLLAGHFLGESAALAAARPPIPPEPPIASLAHQPTGHWAPCGPRQ